MSQARRSDIPEYSAPITVFLNLTQQCNLRCIYCSAEVVEPRRQRGAELSDEEMLALVDRLIEARVFRYTVTGGEPFLRRSLVFAVLERVTLSGHATVLTNGTLITQSDARRLARLPGKVVVSLSIDAPVEEVNAATRGRHVLAKTLRAARYLVDQGVKPKVNCVLSRRNAYLIPELVEFLKQHNLTELQLIKLQPVGYASRTPELVLDKSSRQALLRTVAEFAATEPRMRVVGSSDDWQRYEEVLARYQAQGPPRRRQPTLLPCSAGIDQCAITADGWVVPCNLMPGYHCGNVRERDIVEIWRSSPELESFRRLRATPITVVAECADCRFNVFCNGGCRALALASANTLLGRDPTCPYYEAVPASPAGGIRLPVVD